MRIEIRSDSVILDGYVNAVERLSRPVVTERGKCVEKIEQRAFEKALNKADNVDFLLNHNKNRKLGSIKEGNIELFEDSIGLRAIATVTDGEVIKKAKEHKLKGWSFGMYVNKDRLEERTDNLPIRHVEDLDLIEVSIIDDRLNPVYTATSVETRANEEVVNEQRGSEFRAITIDNTPINYTEYENKINQLKGV
ncbi:HK97 family phage prohead protease [Tissierella creatinophila]|uniref:Caudovirus prohead protease n=1 Tax=Tissierella creatinophila DSM 6911 TaxID=1123403 RepID=A0A1U7M5F0_TISCR|nr:HK97 family phage prohead protease [Tissierella creatinophila]OLS02418.1 caudovirus prohead protease [Tissierella creatinophila DSM 6911]